MVHIEKKKKAQKAKNLAKVKPLGMAERWKC